MSDKNKKQKSRKRVVTIGTITIDSALLNLSAIARETGYSLAYVHFLVHGKKFSRTGLAKIQRAIYKLYKPLLKAA